MKTFDGTYLTHQSRKQSSLASVLLVGSLHVAAIYTLLVALDVVPNPVAPTPPIHGHVIDILPTTAPPPVPSGRTKLVLVQPTTPQTVPRPQIEINATLAGPTIYVPPDRPVVPVIPAPGVTSPLHTIGSAHTIPPYPQLAIRLAHEGTARLKIVVDEQGNVVGAAIVQSTGHDELDAAAVAWVRAHWRYQPALKDGDAIAASTEAVVTFRLDQMH